MDNEPVASDISDNNSSQSEVEKLKKKIEKKDFLREIEKLRSEKNILKLENDVLKLKNEKLEKEKDSKVELKAGNESLKAENQSLKAENESLKAENQSLKAENQSLKAENESLKAKNQLVAIRDMEVSDVKTISVIRFLKRDRIIEGIFKFIEGVESKTNIYDSYSQWYDDVLERMEHQTIYNYQKYLLISSKDSGYLPYWDTEVVFTSLIEDYRYMYRKDTKRWHYSYTFNQGWTHENTNLVCLLHPTDPERFLELDRWDFPGEKNGRVIGHSWQTKSHKKILERCKVVKPRGSGETYSYILLCMKND